MFLTNGRLAAVAVGIPLVLATAGWGAFSMVGLFAHTSERHVASYEWQGGEISVTTSSGSVWVRAGTGTRVEVAYTEHYELKKPTVSASTADGGVQLSAKCPGGIFSNNCDINYVISVPASARLMLHTGSGSVRVAGSTGDASIDVGDGGITLDNVAGAIVAHTGNGGIHGTQVRSMSFEVSTGNGGIGVDWAVVPTAVTATTGNGGIRLAVPAGSGPYRVSTHTGNGGVNVDIPTDPNAKDTIIARTGNGGIRVAFAG